MQQVNFYSTYIHRYTSHACVYVDAQEAAEEGSLSNLIINDGCTGTWRNTYKSDGVGFFGNYSYYFVFITGSSSIPFNTWRKVAPFSFEVSYHRELEHELCLSTLTWYISNYLLSKYFDEIFFFFKWW